MTDHRMAVYGLIAIFLILTSAVVMVFHGIKEDALLLVLFTGSVEIGRAIVGIKPSTSPAPGTTTITAAATPGAGPATGATTRVTEQHTVQVEPHANVPNNPTV